MVSRILVCLLLFLAGCSRGPEWYAPPPQRAAAGGAAPGRLAAFVEMNSLHADTHLLRDVSRFVEAGRWRWAGPRPQMRFHLDAVANLRFVLDFSISEVTFRETGPVSLTFLINGRALERVRFARAGEHRYQKPVPEALLRPGQENVVSIEPDKVWVSREDGARLSIMLSGAGFVE